MASSDDLLGSSPSKARDREIQGIGTWTMAEHERFLMAMAKFPLGPWSAIAAVVGTRSVRQVHSHAQKYAVKVERHTRDQPSDTDGHSPRGEGHRVVPAIPGTLRNRATLDARMSSHKHHHAGLPRGTRSPSPHTVQEAVARAAVLLAEPFSPPPIDRAGIASISAAEVSSHGGGSRTLLSLEESLDFFLQQLDAEAETREGALTCSAHAL